MAVPDDIRIKIEDALREFCERRVPEHVRDKVRLNFTIRGNTVLLFEERPRWNNPSEWINLKIAQLRFDAILTIGHCTVGTATASGIIIRLFAQRKI